MSAPLPDEVLLRWLWLSFRCSPGSRAGEYLIESFGTDIFAVYNAEEARYREVKGLHEDVIRSLCDKELDEAQQVLAYCKNENIGILTPDHPRYPPRLRRINAFPVVLYVKGKLPEIEDSVCIAMVGTRSMTEYGQKAGYRLAYELASCGTVIVSGMAKGVDGIVHRAALDAGAPTIAVLGCGIDRCYPPEHRGLRDEILRHGAIVTEYRPFTSPSGKNFPVRNRIISGLCQATVVVEGDGKSGALITARKALEQGRSLYAMPGHIGEKTGDGPNALIREGARIVTGVSDILGEYAVLYPHRIHLPKEMRKEIPVPPKKEEDGEEERFAVRYETHPVSARQRRQKGEETREEREQYAYGETETKPAPPAIELEGFEKKIWEELDEEIGISPDSLSRRGYDVTEVMTALTVLEIKGAVRSLPGGLYIRL